MAFHEGVLRIQKIEHAMHLTSREFWTALHGMVFGAGLLVLFSGGFVAVWNLGSEASPELLRRRTYWTGIGLWGMALLAWVTVIIGTYLIYPWYRAKVPAGGVPEGLAHFPKFLLLSKPETSEWHNFGMEWKEHIAWLSPLLLSAVACCVSCSGRQVARDATLRRVVLALFTLAFFCASIAGVLGALINKAAPTR
jgi:hypothetical protein